MYQYSEERPQYQIARPSYVPRSNYAALMQQQAAQTERAGTRAAEQIQNMIERPVAAYQKSAREAREERRQQLAEERMQGLSDLQKKQLEQQIASEEEFGRPEREAKLGAYKTQAAQAETQRQLADLQMAQAQKEAELMGKVAPSGRTYAEERIMAPIEATRQQMELASRQATLAEKQAAVNAETQRLTQQNIRLGITETEREMRVRDLAAQIGAETDPAARQAKMTALSQMAKPEEMAAAMRQVAGEQQQAEFWATMSRNNNINYQQQVALNQKANAQIQVQNEALARLDSAIQEMQQATWGSADQANAAKRAAAVFEQMGYPEEAAEVRDAWSFKGSKLLSGQNPFESRLTVAKDARSKVLNSMANNLEAQYGTNEDMRKTAAQYRSMALGMSQVAQTQNIFQMPQQSALGYPTVPLLYNPANPIPGVNPPAPGQTGGAQFVRAPDGTLKLQQGAQQPAAAGGPVPGPQAGTIDPQLMNLLLQGKPLTQQAGR